jgi:hypothetical protein
MMGGNHGSPGDIPLHFQSTGSVCLILSYPLDEVFPCPFERRLFLVDAKILFFQAHARGFAEERRPQEGS